MRCTRRRLPGPGYLAEIVYGRGFRGLQIARHRELTGTSLAPPNSQDSRPVPAMPIGMRTNLVRGDPRVISPARYRAVGHSATVLQT